MQDVRKTEIAYAGIVKLSVIERIYAAKVLLFSLCFFLSLSFSGRCFAECIKKDDKVDNKTINILQSLMVDYGFTSRTGPKYIDVYKLIPSTKNTKKFLIVDLRGCDLNCSAYLVDLPQKKVLETFLPKNAGNDICVSQSQEDRKIYINGDLYDVCDPVKPSGGQFFSSIPDCESNKDYSGDTIFN